MPSRFEPCGLSQMMAMRYGTVPIVHETGGLKDSVRAYREFDHIGDGFSFLDYSSRALYLAVRSGIRLYVGDEDMFHRIQRRCMRKDFSWTRSAVRYGVMYSDIADSSEGESITFQEAYEKLRAAYMKIAEDRKDEIPEGYRRVFQIHITGRGEGVFSIEFLNGAIEVRPYYEHHCDACVAASFDNLIGMAEGTIAPDKLFFNGQMKVTGNIVKGAELRRILVPAAQKAPEQE